MECRSWASQSPLTNTTICGWYSKRVGGASCIGEISPMTVFVILILQTMDDPRLKEDVQRRSRMMRDQPMSPGNWATYWIEYVLRHQGAAHLRSPTLHIPWYQLYNVDVWALLAAVIVVTSGLSFWLSYRILLFLVRCCFWSKKKKDD
ncbi:UDP-glucuronosyltransferase 2B13 [Chionoecetes opilio]|uniref:UDP-glucuronosyltransferase 2B13 n=1 Tax=Chionoecetes opilio TaxID=41210 RepID=A0A8J4YH74_CHIOP|nr:UDP-glucuronosyltransferase 2B13 [Chionoecetes opilio]